MRVRLTRGTPQVSDVNKKNVPEGTLFCLAGYPLVCQIKSRISENLNFLTSTKDFGSPSASLTHKI